MNLLKQQQKAPKFSLLPWNSVLLAPISGRANKKNYAKAHISLIVNTQFSGLGKPRCSLYCRKSGY